MPHNSPQNSQLNLLSSAPLAVLPSVSRAEVPSLLSSLQERTAQNALGYEHKTVWESRKKLAHFQWCGCLEGCLVFISQLKAQNIFFFFFLVPSWKVSVCRVMYASCLWSAADNNSWELFTLFWNASKQCQSFLCFRVLVYSAGSWVLGWQVLSTRCRLFQVIALSTTSNYQTQTRRLQHSCPPVNILSHILNTCALQGAFYVQWKVIVWGSLRDTLFYKLGRRGWGRQQEYTISSMVFTGLGASRPL